MGASMFRLLGPFVSYLLAASCLIGWLGDAYTWPMACGLCIGGFVALAVGAVWMEAKA